MRNSKKIKIKYAYVEPKTKEEAEQQQKALDEVYEDIFKRVLPKRNR